MLETAKVNIYLGNQYNLMLSFAHRNHGNISVETKPVVANAKENWLKTLKEKLINIK